MLKKLFVVIIFAFSLVAMTACSKGYELKDGKIYTSTYGIRGSYKTFDGSYSKTIALNNEEVSFTFVNTTDDGSVQAVIYDADGQYVSVVDGSYTLTSTEKAKFTIKIEAKDHVGNFNLAWTVTSLEEEE